MTCGCNAIYGYVSTLDEDIRQWFISKYIIGEAEHLLSHRRRNRNLLAQADDIVNKTDGRRLTMEMEQTADGLHSISDFQLLTLERRKSVIQEVYVRSMSGQDNSPELRA